MKKKKEFNYERKIIFHKLYGLEELDGDSSNLKEMIDFLTSLYERFNSEGFTDLKIENLGDYDYNDYYITGYRVETDSEYYERLEQYKKQLAKQIAAEKATMERKMKKHQAQMEKERQLYEKLKEKYDTQNINIK